jgi:type IV pilus assembly protein PilC
VGKFHIRAATKDNDAYDEVIDAPDRFAVFRDIRSRGDRILTITEEGKVPLLSASFITAALNGVSGDEKIFMVKNLAAMLDAGLTSSRALAVMERQSKNPRLRSVIGSLIAEVRRGGALSAAFERFKDIFSPLLISMVKAGEESGKLGESLRVVAVQMERTGALQKKIRGALMYPGIVLTAMVGIGVLMLIYVVPTLTATFKELGTDLPPTTKFVIAASTFLSTHTIVALSVLIALVVGFFAGLRTPRGQQATDFLMLRVPLIRNLVMEVNSARTARTLASLLSSGVDMVVAIGITRDVVQNSFYQKVLVQAEAGVVEGAPLSEAFAKHPELYPPLVAEMIAVGEETGKLSELLKEVAEFYENSVDQETKDLSTIVEPFLMIVIGAAVGFFAVSMIAPIYSLSNAI